MKKISFVLFIIVIVSIMTGCRLIDDGPDRHFIKFEQEDDRYKIDYIERDDEFVKFEGPRFNVDTPEYGLITILMYGDEIEEAEPSRKIFTITNAYNEIIYGPSNGAWMLPVWKIYDKENVKSVWYSYNYISLSKEEMFPLTMSIKNTVTNSRTEVRIIKK